MEFSVTVYWFTVPGAVVLTLRLPSLAVFADKASLVCTLLLSDIDIFTVTLLLFSMPRLILPETRVPPDNRKSVSYTHLTLPTKRIV